MIPRFLLALAAIPLVLGSGALGSHAILPHLEVSERALHQPLLVATSWGSSGMLAWAILALTIGAAAVPYALAIRCARALEGSRTALGLVLAVSLAGIAVSAAFAFVFSSDIYAYAAYGALVSSGGDPYRPHLMAQTTLAGPAFDAAIRYE